MLIGDDAHKDLIVPIRANDLRIFKRQTRFGLFPIQNPRHRFPKRFFNRVRRRRRYFRRYGRRFRRRNGRRFRRDAQFVDLCLHRIHFLLIVGKLSFHDQEPRNSSQNKQRDGRDGKDHRNQPPCGLSAFDAFHFLFQFIDPAGVRVLFQGSLYLVPGLCHSTFEFLFLPADSCFPFIQRFSFLIRDNFLLPQHIGHFLFGRLCCLLHFFHALHTGIVFSLHTLTLGAQHFPFGRRLLPIRSVHILYLRIRFLFQRFLLFFQFAGLRFHPTFDLLFDFTQQHNILL